MTSPMDSLIRGSTCVVSSYDQSLPVPANHDTPVCADDDVSGVTLLGWEPTVSCDAVGNQAVTIQRCRSDDTLSSVSDWPARNPRETSGLRRHQVQMHRPSLCGQHRVLVEMNHRGNEDVGDVFSLSRTVDESNRSQHGAFRRPIVLV